MLQPADPTWMAISSQSVNPSPPVGRPVHSFKQASRPPSRARANARFVPRLSRENVFPSFDKTVLKGGTSSTRRPTSGEQPVEDIIDMVRVKLHQCMRDRSERYRFFSRKFIKHQGNTVTPSTLRLGLYKYFGINISHEDVLRMMHHMGFIQQAVETISEKDQQKLSKTLHVPLRPFLGKLDPADYNADLWTAKRFVSVNKHIADMKNDYRTKGMMVTKEHQSTIKWPIAELEKKIKMKLETIGNTVKEAFAAFQLNEGHGDHGNVIDPDEFKLQLQKLGIPMTQSEADEIFKKYDENGDGTLDLYEFISSMVSEDYTDVLWHEKAEASRQERLKVLREDKRKAHHILDPSHEFVPTSLQAAVVRAKSVSEAEAHLREKIRERTTRGIDCSRQAVLLFGGHATQISTAQFLSTTKVMGLVMEAHVQREFIRKYEMSPGQVDLVAFMQEMVSNDYSDQLWFHKSQEGMSKRQLELERERETYSFVKEEKEAREGTNTISADEGETLGDMIEKIMGTKQKNDGAAEEKSKDIDKQMKSDTTDMTLAEVLTLVQHKLEARRKHKHQRYVSSFNAIFDRESLGMVDIAGFAAGLMSLGITILLHRVVELFAFVDTDKDGYVSAHDLQAALEQVSDDQKDKFEAWAPFSEQSEGHEDEDGDGKGEEAKEPETEEAATEGNEIPAPKVHKKLKFNAALAVTRHGYNPAYTHGSRKGGDYVAASHRNLVVANDHSLEFAQILVLMRRRAEGKHGHKGLFKLRQSLLRVFEDMDQESTKELSHSAVEVCIKSFFNIQLSTKQLAALRSKYATTSGQIEYRRLVDDVIKREPLPIAAVENKRRALKSNQVIIKREVRAPFASDADPAPFYVYSATQPKTAKVLLKQDGTQSPMISFTARSAVDPDTQRVQSPYPAHFYASAQRSAQGQGQEPPYSPLRRPSSRPRSRSSRMS